MQDMLKLKKNEIGKLDETKFKEMTRRFQIVSTVKIFGLLFIRTQVSWCLYKARILESLAWKEAKKK